MKQVAISLKNVTKVYGKKDLAVKALDDINLDIYSGESLAIIGKSGSGKSTLVHNLALLDRPTKGQVFIGGVDATKLTTKKLNKLRNSYFGFIFQQFFMNPRDSVLNNVMLPMVVAGIKPKSRKKRALKALELVDLADKVKSKASDLSGGQKQRVCIARAISNSPKTIIADEPTGNLDSVTGKIVSDMLFDLNRKKGITLIIVTHDEDLASQCDRQIRLKDGQIIDDTKSNKAAKGAK